MSDKPTYEELEQRIKQLENAESDRKQAEEALRESEEKYRSMMESMTEPAYICTSDFRVSYMNPAMIKRIGHNATDEICYKAINALDEQCPWCVHDKIQQGESAEIEIDSPKDGRSFQTSHAPIFHQNGAISKMTIYRDITERKKAEETLEKTYNELENKTRQLAEINTALNILLEKKDEDKTAFEDQMLTNVKNLIMPYLERMKKDKTDDQQQVLIDILEINLKEIVSPFAQTLSAKYMYLTPAEIRVADLIRQGKKTKEIAAFLNRSYKTIERHRENIRKKMGIKNEKAHLQTYLLSHQ